MDNVQKHNICTNVPSSQTFISYLLNICNHVHKSLQLDIILSQMIRVHVFSFILLRSILILSSHLRQSLLGVLLPSCFLTIRGINFQFLYSMKLNLAKESNVLALYNDQITTRITAASEWAPICARKHDHHLTLFFILSATFRFNWRVPSTFFDGRSNYLTPSVKEKCMKAL
jgi:hypothetical protein